MSTDSYGHTAHYTYIEGALRARWATFVALEAEMGAFVPEPLSAFDAARDAEVKRLSALNPHKPIQEFVEFVGKQIAFKASPQWQFREKFEDRHMADYAAVVMLSHALCEALINAVLAIGLAQKKTADLFSLIERAEFKQKWLVGPKALSENYQFPRGSGLHEALLRLTRQRNALVHHKIELEMNGTKVLEGSGFERASYAEEQHWLRRFFSLPYDLADFLRRALPGSHILILFGSGPIARSPANSAASQETPSK